MSDPLPSLAGMQPKVGATMTIACDQCWAAIRVERALPLLLPVLARYMPCHDHKLRWDYAMFDEDVLDHVQHWVEA